MSDQAPCICLWRLVDYLGGKAREPVAGCPRHAEEDTAASPREKGTE